MSAIIAQLGVVRRDGRVTDSEWNSLSTDVAKLAKRATLGADELVRAYYRDDMSPQVRAALRRILLDRGYDVRRSPLGLSEEHQAKAVRSAMAANVTRVDRGFEALAAKFARDKDNVTVAVIEGGFDFDAPALSDNISVNTKEIAGDGKDNDGNGLVDDVIGWDFRTNQADQLKSRHGTHVMGIATAGTDRIKAVPVSARGATATDGSLVKAIDYVVARGARVVNISKWIKGDLAADIEKAMAKHPNVLFIKSAGNQGGELGVTDNLRNDLAKRQLANMLVVASTGADGKITSRSNYSSTYVDIAARGGRVMSSFPNGEYASMSGTSMATPQVTRALGKCLLLNPDLTAVQMRRIVRLTVKQRDVLEDKVKSGGALNEQLAFRLALVVHLVDQGKKEDQVIRQVGRDTAEQRALLKALRAYQKEEQSALPLVA